jgi:predicted regulator of Ras-like GTPase activity (Roadblock/LC7/MglB family)
LPYKAILERLVDSVDGVQAALLLDANGEVVVDAGERGERQRLIGAYQGIALARAREVDGRYATGEIQHVLCRYSGGHVILRPLKDGYYLVVSLAPSANVGLGLFRSAESQERMNEAL